MCCDAVPQVVIDPVYMVGTNKQVRQMLVPKFWQVATLFHNSLQLTNDPLAGHVARHVVSNLRAQSFSQQS
jgi:hypothetical protein